jgi:hypothetical protein
VQANRTVLESAEAEERGDPITLQNGLPRVLYLAGIPRTGSTVLGQVMGYIPGTIFVGELSLFWRRFANSELCSCGNSLPRCEFWSKVISEGFGELSYEDALDLSRLEWAVRQRQAITSLLPIRRQKAMLGRYQTIAEARTNLYGAIAKLAQAPWVIDSGKDPWFGVTLGSLFGHNFSTIHIVRDPRGVAFSWTKMVKSDSEPGFMPRRRPWRAALSWLFQNLVIQFFLRRLSVSYIRLRYEDLVADPKSAVCEVARSMGVDADRLAALGYDEGGRDLHWVAGNPRVRESSGSRLEVKLDEEWRDQLPRVQRWLVAAICGVLFLPYGYRL